MQSLALIAPNLIKLDFLVHYFLFKFLNIFGKLTYYLLCLINFVLKLISLSLGLSYVLLEHGIAELIYNLNMITSLVNLGNLCRSEFDAEFNIEF